MSTADYAEYKGLRVAVKKAVGELDREWGQGAEWTIAYVRPFGLDVQVGGMSSAAVRG